MKKILLFFCLVFSCGLLSFGQTEEDSFRDKLITYMEVTGAENVYNTVIVEMIEMYRNQLGLELDDFLVKYRNRMMEDSFLELVDMLLPVYKKHFAESDLDAIIAFYQTDAGKKLAQETPLLTKEAMEIGQLWGMKIGREILEEMKQE